MRWCTALTSWMVCKACVAPVSHRVVNTLRIPDADIRLDVGVGPKNGSWSTTSSEQPNIGELFLIVERGNTCRPG